MAIIITANQIYDILSNDKIIDNTVKGISLEVNDFVESETVLRNENNPSNTNIHTETSYSDWSYLGSAQRDRFEMTVEYNRISLSIQSQYGLVENTVNSTLYITTTGNVNNITNRESNAKRISSIDNYEYQLNNIPPPNNNQENPSTVSYANSQIINKPSFIISDFTPYSFSIQIIFIKKITTRYRAQINNGIEWNDVANNATNINPEITEFSVEIKSNTSTENFSSIIYGNSPLYSVESNELLQINTLVLRNNSNYRLSQYMYEQITANYQWGRGKELATILCSIGEYYNEDGELAISVENNNLPMIFNIGDYVIPYIPAADGKTEPMSIRTDGTPKKFRITQVRPYFDGACWQELYLQEQAEMKEQEMTISILGANQTLTVDISGLAPSGTIVSVESQTDGVIIVEYYTQTFVVQNTTNNTIQNAHCLVKYYI